MEIWAPFVIQLTRHVGHSAPHEGLRLFSVPAAVAQFVNREQ